MERSPPAAATPIAAREELGFPPKKKEKARLEEGHGYATSDRRDPYRHQEELGLRRAMEWPPPAAATPTGVVPPPAPSYLGLAAGLQGGRGWGEDKEELGQGGGAQGKNMETEAITARAAARLLPSGGRGRARSVSL